MAVYGARWLAIVNPAAGGGAGAKLIGSLARTLSDAGIRAEIERSPGPGEGARLAAAATEDGYDVILAVGGDGTANEIANGMLGSRSVLALYPVGMGNDFARGVGYPRRARDLPRFLAQATPRDIDVGLANGRAFINHVGVGIDGVVAQRARGFAHYVGHSLGYAASAVAAVLTYRPAPMQVSLDGEERSGRFLLVVAANGRQFGGGMKVAPGAQLDDGWLDVCLGGELGPGPALAALLRLYRGTHVDGKRVQSARARELDITLERPMPMEIDGEVSSVRSIEVRIRPQALRVLA